jgi:hypothetical protein
MDITVCVMLPERGATDYSTSAHPKWRVLEPVAVTIAGDTSQPITAPRTGYIHVTNIPSKPEWMGLPNEEVLRFVASSICAPGLAHRKAWKGDETSLPLPMRQALLTDRQITITWGQFKAFFQNGSRSFADGDI